jgi:hypothetical protein
MTKEYKFDFGFSAMDEDELDAVQQASAKVKAADDGATEVADRLHKLYNMVTPLLNNLASNPEKDYIYWPQRLSKIEEFRDALDAVYSGK